MSDAVEIERISIAVPTPHGMQLMHDEVGQHDVTELWYDAKNREVTLGYQINGHKFERVLNLRICFWWQVWADKSVPIAVAFPPQPQPPSGPPPPR